MDSPETIEYPKLKAIPGGKIPETESSRFRQTIFGKGIDDPLQDSQEGAPIISLTRQKTEQAIAPEETTSSLDALRNIQAEEERRNNIRIIE